MVNKKELGLSQRLRAISKLVKGDTPSATEEGCRILSADEIEFIQRLCLGKSVEGEDLVLAEKLMAHDDYKSVLDIPKHFALDPLWMDLVVKAVINAQGLEDISTSIRAQTAYMKVQKNSMNTDQCKALSELLVAGIAHANTRGYTQIDLSDVLYTILLENGPAVNLTGLKRRNNR